MRARSLGLLALFSLLATAWPAAAHEHVCFQGDARTDAPEGGSCAATNTYEFVVGWKTEPPVTGVLNGLDLGVKWPGNNTWVTNVTTLAAQYEYGGKTFPLDLEGQFGRAGWYTSPVIPTRPGQYTVRVGGTLLGKAFNFTVDPAAVDPASDLQFPEKGSDPAILAQQVLTLQGQVNALQSQVNTLMAQRNATRSDVAPEPAPTPAGTNKTPGFEALPALALLGGVALVAARRRGGR